MNSDSQREIEFTDDIIVYITADKGPSLFKAVCPDFIGLVTESSEKLRDLLPDNFDISKHIYELSGTYFT